MSETTRNRIRSGHWATAAALFFGSLIVDLMDGHSDPLVQTLLAYVRMSAMAVFIAGCLLVMVGRIDRIVRAPEQPAADPMPDDAKHSEASEYVASARERLRRRGVRLRNVD